MTYMSKIVTQLNADLAEQRTSLGIITDELTRLKKFAEAIEDRCRLKPCSNCGAPSDLDNPQEKRFGMCYDCTEGYLTHGQ